MLYLAAVLINFDSANANGKAGALALTFLCIEFTVDEYDAGTDNFPVVVLLSLPCFKISQIS